METKREDLIDFINWLDTEGVTINFDKGEAVDEYLSKKTKVKKPKDRYAVMDMNIPIVPIPKINRGALPPEETNYLEQSDESYYVEPSWLPKGYFKGRHTLFFLNDREL